MAHPDSFSSNARYSSALLDGGEDQPKLQARRWKLTAAAAGVFALGMAAAVGLLVQERAALNEARQQLEALTQYKSYAATGNKLHSDAASTFARA